jgi:divalent metal cation (Fe/Co/Zn/Cd) transporter
MDYCMTSTVHVHASMTLMARLCSSLPTDALSSWQHRAAERVGGTYLKADAGLISLTHLPAH